MRQLVLIIGGWIVLNLFLPRAWDKVMSTAPPLALQWILFFAALVCLAVVAFSDPIYRRLVAPSQFPVASTLLAASLCFCAVAAGWWFLIVPQPLAAQKATEDKADIAVVRVPTTETPTQEPKIQRMMPPLEARSIRDSIMALAHEIELLSGKQFKDEIILMPGEQLAPDSDPQSLFALTPNSGFCSVKSLGEIRNKFAAVDAFLYRQNPQPIGGMSPVPGYEEVHQEYFSLQGMRWAVNAHKYRDGADLSGGQRFHICVYGLKPVDMRVLERLRASVEKAEAAIRSVQSSSDSSKPASKPVSAAQWRKLGADFRELQTYGVRADWQKNSILGEQWGIRGGPADCRNIEVLCRKGGTMLLKSPQVEQQLSERVRAHSDPVWRWLEYVKEVSGGLTDLGHGVGTNDGVPVESIYWGRINDLQAKSVIACSDCETMEL